MNLAQLSVQDLVKLLEQPNIWQRRTAQRMLTERLAGRAALPEKTSATKAIEALLEKGLRRNPTCRFMDPSRDRPPAGWNA